MHEHKVETTSFASETRVEKRDASRSFLTGVAAARLRFPVKGGSTVTVLVVVATVEVVYMYLYGPWTVLVIHIGAAVSVV